MRPVINQIGLFISILVHGNVYMSKVWQEQSVYTGANKLTYLKKLVPIWLN